MKREEQAQHGVLGEDTDQATNIPPPNSPKATFENIMSGT